MRKYPYLPLEPTRQSLNARTILLSASTLIFAFLIVILLYVDTPLPDSLASHLPSFFISRFCPTPHLPRRVISTTGYTSEQCYSPTLQSDLTTSSFPWSLQICTREKECNAASLFLTAHHPEQCRTDRPVSEDPELDEYIKKVYGPAEWRVEVVGSEMWTSGRATFWREEAGEELVGGGGAGGGSVVACGYRIPVALRNAGEARMQLWQFFDNFQAFDEVNKTWPEQLRLPVLQSPLILPSCPSACPTHYSPIPLDPATPALRPQSPASFAHHLPSCLLSTSDTLPGSYLPYPANHTMEDIYPPTRHWSSHHKSGEYGFVPEGCVWRHQGTRFSLHNGCRAPPDLGLDTLQGDWMEMWEDAGEATGQPGAATDSADTSLEMSNGGEAGAPRGVGEVWVYGDSHGRVLYDSIVHRLNGSREYSIRSDKAGDKNATLPSGQTLRCKWDPQAYHLNTVLVCSSLSTVSTLIVSTGSHQATGHTTTNFLYSLRFIEKFAECPSTNQYGEPITLILAITPPQPPRQDEPNRNSNDRRTLTRLKHWNDLMLDRVEEVGKGRWKVLDQMTLFEPYLFDVLQTDMAHYLDTDGLEAAIDQVLAQMGGCGVGEVDVREEQAVYTSATRTDKDKTAAVIEEGIL